MSPGLKIARMTLKAIGPEDRDFIFAQFSDPRVTRYLYDQEPLADPSGADRIIAAYRAAREPVPCRWVLVRTADGVKLGTCGFHRWDDSAGTVEVGYDLGPEHRGAGYMTEALTAAVVYLKAALPVRRLEAHISADNAPSMALAERLGLRYGGKDITYRFRGTGYPHRVYAMDL